MTKLIDLKGAIETFIIDIDKVAVSNVHLEVDVEAMAQKIYEYEHPNDTHWDNLTDGQKHEYIRKADFLTLWLTKWARLVRK